MKLMQVSTVRKSVVNMVSAEQFATIINRCKAAWKRLGKMRFSKPFFLTTSTSIAFTAEPPAQN